MRLHIKVSYFEISEKHYLEEGESFFVTNPIQFTMLKKEGSG